MVIDTYIIYESLEGLSCYNIIGGVGVPVSLRHNSVVRIRGSSLTSALKVSVSRNGKTADQTR
jgi:hypothetical protein